MHLVGPNIGALLLSICCLTTSAMCFLTTRLIKRFGYVNLIASHYVVLCVFLLAHFYPAIWLLLPAYIILGLTLGPAWVCKWNLVVFFASRVSCGQHECNNTTVGENTDDHKVFCNREERVRRLARWFHGIQDIGIFIGAVLASIIISCAASENGCFHTNIFFTAGTKANATDTEQTSINTLNVTNNGIDYNSLSRTIIMNADNLIDEQPTIANGLDTAAKSATSSFNFYEFYQNALFQQRDELLNSMFNQNERGMRICGSGSCPSWDFETIEVNATEEYNWFRYSDTVPITVIYLMFGIAALTLACLSQPVDNTLKYENKKSITDTLLLAGPMAYFIGTEQGYVLGDFTRVSLYRSFTQKKDKPQSYKHDGLFTIFSLRGD